MRKQSDYIQTNNVAAFLEDQNAAAIEALGQMSEQETREESA